jgi:hypothetical protein
LPHLQKLYDKIKDRKDIQLITFNIDDNVGLVGPFLKQNNYTLPVIPAKFLVESMLGQVGVPRNWLVDGEGVLRSELLGFGENEKWEAQMVEAMEKAKAPASKASL